MQTSKNKDRGAKITINIGITHTAKKGYFDKLNDLITKNQFFHGFEQEIMFYGVERLFEVNL